MKKSAGNVNFWGIMFNSDHSAMDAAGYWNNAAMLILDDGNYGFYTCVDNDWTGLPNWTADPAVVAGIDSWNTLKVIVNNDNGDYHCFINDVYIQTVNTTVFDSGDLGLIMYDGGLIGTADVDFVNVSAVSKATLDNIDVKYAKLVPTSAPHIK